MADTLTAYLPGLPSILDAKKDYNQVTSDHIPILTTIPTELEPIKILSWNVLENEKNGSGFAENHKVFFSESEAQKSARFDRIANTIRQIAIDQKPQFIALQEIKADLTQSNTLLEKIINALPNGYLACFDHADKLIDHGGCITFYNKEQFTPLSAPSDTHKTNAELNGNVIKLTRLHNEDYKIRLANIHHRHTENTKKHEKNIRAFLLGEDNATPKAEPENNHLLSIMVGNFNGTIAPHNPHNEKRNIITSVDSSHATKHEAVVKKAMAENTQVQRAWAADGCFYAERLAIQNKYSTVLKQASFVPFHPLEARPYTDAELKPKDLNSLSAFERYELTRMRLSICIDAHFFNKIIGGDKTINGHKITIDSLNKYIEDMFAHDKSSHKIYVRPAVNLLNETGIGAVIPDDWVDYFNVLKDFHPNFTLDKKQDWLHNAEPFNVVYARDEHIEELTKAIQRLAKNPDLAAFARQIAILAHDKNMANSDTIKHYQNLLIALIHAADTKTHAIVLKHFSDLCVRLHKGPMKLENLMQSQIELEEALSGKPPASKTIRTLSGCLYGALIGLAIGLLACTAITIALSGTAAIPLMFADLFTNINFANILTASTTAIGTVSGGLHNFFKAKGAENQFITAAEKKNSLVDTAVAEQKTLLYQAMTRK